MAIGYKDFLSSPIFPRYGLLNIYSKDNIAIAQQTNTLIYSFTGRALIEGISVYTGQLPLTSEPVIQYVIDGNSYTVPVYGFAYDNTNQVIPLFNPHVTYVNIENNDIYFALLELFHVGQSISLLWSDQQNTGTYYINLAVKYYPVE